jgi:DNA mismatch endonuclease (patch repair protein)
MSANAKKLPTAPAPVSAAVSAVMRANRGRDTRPEMIVRRLVFRLGYRYRLHHQRLPGRPDIAFTRRRKAVFVHGCFWHQHRSAQCPLRSRPLSHLDYWDAKLKRNEERDIEKQEELRQIGWDIMIVWECEIQDALMLTRRIQEFLGPP